MNDKCIICGCMDDHACDVAGEPCYWVERDLCSGCAPAYYAKHGLRLTVETVRMLQQGRVQFVMDGQQLLQFVATVQLACRHPKFEGETRQFMEGLARKLGDQLSEASGQLRYMVEAGWDQNLEVPAPEKSRIIIPN